MKLIDRYVYAVTRYLPEKQKADIERELRTLIDDMLEENQENISYEKKVEKVLLELGDPTLLADSYRGTKRYLIGPQNFDNYIFILRIVLGAVFLGITVATVVGAFADSSKGIIGFVANYFAVMISALLQAFAWVTAAFAIAEYNGVDLLDKKEEDWSIKDLPELPQKEAVIPRSESIVSIVFSTLFTSILLFAPQIFAAYINNGSGSFIMIPLFNIPVISQYKALLIVVFVLGIIKELLKLYYRRWTLKLSIPVALLSVALGIISVLIFTNPSIWNPNFAVIMTKYMEIDIAGVNLWSSLSTGLAAVIIIATLVEVATNVYKGFKYDK